ncbi:MAG: NAD-dependent epimerase/dehydratase family protein [Patescibacteria group bacterium]
MNKIIEQDCREILSRVDFTKIKGKKILVTGATGFLGQYVVAALSLANNELKLNALIYAVGFSSPKRSFSSILEGDPMVKFKKVDLSGEFNLKGFDYIFHAAGYGQPAKFIDDPLSLVKINVNATSELLKWSPKSTFIYFSSAEIYGEVLSEFIPTKEDYNGNHPLHKPRSVYGESKRLGEALCSAYKMKNGTNVKIVRISHIYGPGLPISDTRVMSDFIRKALVEKNIILLDEGRAVKTYGYITDVISMIFFTAFKGKDMVYNVGGQDSISIYELAKKISKYTKASCKIPKTRSTISHIGKDPVVVRLDLSKIIKEMKRFNFTTFDKGLERTIEWAREQIK